MSTEVQETKTKGKKKSQPTPTASPSTPKSAAKTTKKKQTPAKVDASKMNLTDLLEGVSTHELIDKFVEEEMRKNLLKRIAASKGIDLDSDDLVAKIIGKKEPAKKKPAATKPKKTDAKSSPVLNGSTPPETKKSPTKRKEGETGKKSTKSPKKATESSQDASEIEKTGGKKASPKKTPITKTKEIKDTSSSSDSDDDTPQNIPKTKSMQKPPKTIVDTKIDSSSSDSSDDDDDVPTQNVKGVKSLQKLKTIQVAKEDDSSDDSSNSDDGELLRMQLFTKTKQPAKVLTKGTQDLTQKKPLIKTAVTTKSQSSSSDSSDSEMEVDQAVTKMSKTKISVKKTAKKADDSSSGSDSSEDEPVKKVPIKTAQKPTPIQKKTPVSKPESTSDDSSDSDDSDVADTAKKQAVKPTVSPQILKKKPQTQTQQKQDSDSSSSESDSDAPVPMPAKKPADVPVTKTPPTKQHKKADTSSSEESSSEDEMEVEGRGMKKQTKDPSESEDSSSESDEDQEGAVGLKLGVKRSRPADSNTSPFSSKQQKFDNEKNASEKFSAYIGKLAFRTTEANLTRFLSKKGCKPISVRIITDFESGKSKGFGYADFSSKSDMDKCLGLDGEELDGFNIRCDMANRPSGGGGGGGGGGFNSGNRKSGQFNTGGNSSGFQGAQKTFPPGKRLKINNLSWNTNKDSLESKFQSAIDVFLVMDKDTGKSRGFGYIEFESVGEATKQMKKWNGKSVDGRAVRLEFAGERPQSGSGGARGGGFQGGRGGPQKFGRSPNPSRKGAIQPYEGYKKKFQTSDSD